jgi:acyl-CoA thioesterase I
MRLSLRLLLVALVMSAACGGSEPAEERATRVEGPAAGANGEQVTAERPPAEARPRIVFLGDSLTAGLGLPPDDSVPALIQKRLDDEGHEYEVVNAGVSGDTSAGGLSRLDWSLDGDVRVLVIELGGNDGLRGLPVAAMRQNIDEIIRRAKQRGITVLLTGMEAPPNYGEAYTSEFRRAFRDLAREHGVAFVPFYLEGVAGVPGLNQSDEIHPNAEGSRVIERLIWASLEPLLVEKDQ